jgi:serine/threonine-protein kinase
VQTGTVTLAVSPWGYVEVGGKPMGPSPPLQKLTLPEGTHTITIRNEDFAPHVTTVRITADKAATVKHRFAQ